MTQLSKEDRAIIKYRRQNGHSVRSIASDFMCSVSTVHHWSKEGRGCDRKHRTVQKLLLDHDGGTRAAQLLKSKEVGGARFVANQLSQEGHTERVPSRQTVVRAAKKAAKASGDTLKYVRGRPKKALTPANKQQRVAFCRANSRRNWRHVMFTDRCKFHFRYPGQKVRAGRWVSASDSDDGGVVKPNHPQCYNVYGGITPFGATKLIPVTGTSGMKCVYLTKQGKQGRNITAAEYKVVVSEGLLPCGQGKFSIGYVPNWVLQQDGDPTHRAAKAADTLKNLFNSVPKRMDACVKNEGGRIKY